MKKRLSKILALALALSMVMGMSVCAFADEDTAGNYFCFDYQTLYLAPGDTFTMNLYCAPESGIASDSYSAYATSETAKGTYVWSDTWKIGNSKVTFYIDPNETAKSVNYYFYRDGSDCYQEVYVKIVDPSASMVTDTRVKAYNSWKENYLKVFNDYKALCISIGMSEQDAYNAAVTALYEKTGKTLAEAMK